MHKPVEVKLYGEYALFCRPEMKAERVSYEVPTPSAIRGILEAIFFHPPMQWRVRQIHVLKPIKHISIMRNEINLKASPQNDGISITDERTQRHSLVLRDVEYLIKADVYLPGSNDPNDLVKYRDQFRRRVERGQCFHRPYFGCREFPVDFTQPNGTEEAISHTVDLGLMLFDIQYGSKNIPRFYNARLESGVVYVPDTLYSGGDGQ